MADFSKSFSYRLDMYEVDPITWAERTRVGSFTKVSVSRTTGRMVESASMEIDLPKGWEFAEGYYRIVMRVTQGNATERLDLATMYCTATAGTIDHDVNEVKVEGLSVLYPARDCVVDLGSYVAKGADGAAYAGRLLSEVIHAPVEVMGSFEMADNYVFDVGARRLDCAWDVLESANWCIQIDGRGRVAIMPLPTMPTAEIGGEFVMPGIPYELDWSDVPNRYIAMLGTTLAECVNDSPDSVVSTTRRGFVKDSDIGIDTSPLLVVGETLQSYCRRRLKEESTVTHTITHKREYVDGVYPYSVVRVTVQPEGTQEDVRVASQEITCTNELLVEETYVREVPLWP